MPNPRKSESKQAFVKRCIPELVREGKKPNQAVAVCNSMFIQSKKK